MLPLLLNYLRAIICAITIIFRWFYLGRLHRPRLPCGISICHSILVCDELLRTKTVFFSILGDCRIVQWKHHRNLNQRHWFLNLSVPRACQVFINQGFQFCGPLQGSEDPGDSVLQPWGTGKPSGLCGSKNKLFDVKVWSWPPATSCKPHRKCKPFDAKVWSWTPSTSCKPHRKWCHL